MSSDMIGKRINGYEIVRVLGRGGMGVVYKANEMTLQRVVALKVLPGHLADNKEFITRFYREARAAAQLNHPNVVTVHRVGEDDGYHYIAMEFLKGREVTDLIKERKHLDVNEALEITRQVASALAAAHELGILHRDIKPQNIMIDELGRTKVMDFGIAKMNDPGGGGQHLTMTGQLLGTPAYMAPEQCQGLPTDHRADIYSLGVVLFQMLSGRLPFTGETPLAVIRKIVEDELPAIYSFNQEVPDGVVQIMHRMLEKDPANRYQNANDVERDIRAVLGGQAPGAFRGGDTAAAALDSEGATMVGGGVTAAQTRGAVRTKAMPDKGISATRGFSAKSKAPLIFLGVAVLVAIAAIGAAVVKINKRKQAAIAAASIPKPKETPAAETPAAGEGVSLAKLIPAEGGPGTQIVISGSGFSPSGNKVRFDATAEVEVASTDGKILSFIVPEMPPAMYHVIAVSGSGVESNALAFNLTKGTGVPAGSPTASPEPTKTPEPPKVTLTLAQPEFTEGENVVIKYVVELPKGDATNTITTELDGNTAKVVKGETISLEGVGAGKHSLKVNIVSLHGLEGFGTTAFTVKAAPKPKATEMEVAGTPKPKATPMEMASIPKSTPKMTPEKTPKPAMTEKPEETPAPSEGSGEQPYELGKQGGSVRSVAFSANGKMVLSGGDDNTAVLWDVAGKSAKQKLGPLKAPVQSVALSKDFAITGSQKGEVVVWSLSSGSQVSAFAGHSSKAGGTDSRVLAVGFAGDTCVSGSQDGVICSWSRSSGSETARVKAGAINSLAFSKDGKLAVAGCADKTIRLFDLGTGAEKLTFASTSRTGKAPAAQSVALSPDGRKAAAGIGSKIYLFDTGSGAVGQTLTGHSGDVYALAFSPDGGNLLSGGKDSVVMLWDLNTGQKLEEMRGHTASVFSVAFSGDSGHGTSVSGDSSVRVFGLPH